MTWRTLNNTCMLLKLMLDQTEGNIKKESSPLREDAKFGPKMGKHALLKHVTCLGLYLVNTWN